MMTLTGERMRRNGPVAAILLLGFALRLIRLDARYIWYDEAFSILYSGKRLAAILYGTIAQVDGAAADVHPLGYYFLLHFWQAVFGDSVFAVRFLSVVAGMLSIALVLVVTRELFGMKVALAGTLITALAPFHISYSQEARMYSLLTLWTLLMAWFFVRAARGRTWGEWAGFIMAGALCLYTQNLAFLYVLALDFWVLLTRRWRLFRPLVVSHLGMAVLFLPWLILLPNQFGKVRQAYWVEVPGAAELARTVICFTFNLPVPSWVLPAAVALSVCLLVLTLYRALRVVGLSDALSLVFMLSFAPIAVLFLLSQFKSIYIIRGLLPAAVAYYALLAAVWVGIRVPLRLIGAAVAPFVCVAVISLQAHYTYASFPRSPYPELVRFLRAQYREGDVIVHDNKLTMFPAYYYDPSLPQEYIPDPPGSGSDTLALPTQEALGLLAVPLDRVTEGCSRLWFIIFQRAIDEYRVMGKEGHPDKMWLDARYELVGRWVFNDMDVYLYDLR